VTLKMTLGPFMTLTGVGGNEVAVREGEDETRVVIVQKDKVVLFNVEDNCVEQTWYGGTENKIQGAVASMGLFGKSKVLIIVNKTAIAIGNEESKISNCEKIEFNRDIQDILFFENQHWLVFLDGSVELLEQFYLNDKDDWILPDALLVKGATILQSQLVRKTPHCLISHLFQDTGGNLILIIGRVVLNTESKSHNITSVEKYKLGTSKNIIKSDLSEELGITILKASGHLCTFNKETNAVEEIMKIPSTEHCSLVTISSGQVAVMGTLPEGGFLKLISTNYGVAVAECKVKNTMHSGKGMFLVNNRLFLSMSSKIVTVQIEPYLNGGLSMLLGISAAPQAQISYNVIPQLIEECETSKLKSTLSTIKDIPEQLLLDCFLYFMDKDKTNFNDGEEMETMNILFSYEISQALMSEEVLRLSLNHVVKLLKTLNLLLQQPPDVVTNNEKNLFEWASMLITSHYMQLVVSRDADVLDVVNDVHQTIKIYQDTMKLMGDSKIKVHNMLNTKLPPVKNNNQAYCIEIIQI